MLKKELDNLSISRYDFKKNAYKDSVALRQKILLDPLNTELKIQDYDDPENDILLGAFLGDRLIGTVTVTPENKKIKMRQFAVEEAFQGVGVGAELVKQTENYVKALGFSEIYLHAREYVIPFYSKFGYKKVGNRLIEVSLPHWEMHKAL